MMKNEGEGASDTFSVSFLLVIQWTFLVFLTPPPALEIREWDRDDALEGRDTSICRAINATYARFFFFRKGRFISNTRNWWVLVTTSSFWKIEIKSQFLLIANCPHIVKYNLNNDDVCWRGNWRNWSGSKRKSNKWKLDSNQNERHHEIKEI